MAISSYLQMKLAIGSRSCHADPLYWLAEATMDLSAKLHHLHFKPDETDLASCLSVMPSESEAEMYEKAK